MTNLARKLLWHFIYDRRPVGTFNPQAVLPWHNLASGAERGCCENDYDGMPGTGVFQRSTPWLWIYCRGDNLTRAWLVHQGNVPSALIEIYDWPSLLRQSRGSFHANKLQLPLVWCESWDGRDINRLLHSKLEEE
jgi:hypothetical protein